MQTEHYYYISTNYENIFNPFYATGQHPLKILENLWFADVFRGYIKRPVKLNGLMINSLMTEVHFN